MVLVQVILSSSIQVQYSESVYDRVTLMLGDGEARSRADSRGLPWTSWADRRTTVAAFRKADLFNDGSVSGGM